MEHCCIYCGDQEDISRCLKCDEAWLCPTHNEPHSGAGQGECAPFKGEFIQMKYISFYNHITWCGTLPLRWRCRIWQFLPAARTQKLFTDNIFHKFAPFWRNFLFPKLHVPRKNRGEDEIFDRSLHWIFLPGLEGVLYLAPFPIFIPLGFHVCKSILPNQNWIFHFQAKFAPACN